MKKEWQMWEIVIETITVIASLLFLGLQIYYGYIYERSLITLLYHLLPVVLLYAGMTVLQMFPELLNGCSGDPLQGKVRIYGVRMVRNCKMLVILGMLCPSAADALGIEMNAAYSLFVMAGILGTIVYYLVRIYQYNSAKKD